MKIDISKSVVNNEISGDIIQNILDRFNIVSTDRLLLNWRQIEYRKPNVESLNKLINGIKDAVDSIKIQNLVNNETIEIIIQLINYLSTQLKICNELEKMLDNVSDKHDGIELFQGLSYEAFKDYHLKFISYLYIMRQYRFDIIQSIKEKSGYFYSMNIILSLIINTCPEVQVPFKRIANLADCPQVFVNRIIQQIVYDHPEVGKYDIVYQYYLKSYPFDFKLIRTLHSYRVKSSMFDF